MCLLGNLDHQDEVQLGGEVDGLGEEVGVLLVLEVGDGGPVRHVLVLVGHGGVLGDLVRVGILCIGQIFF